MTLEQQIERWNLLPPILCRFLARTGTTNGCRPKTKAEIARDSGLSSPHIVYLSRLHNWDRVPLRTIVAFTRGCGVNLMQPGNEICAWRRLKGKFFENARPTQLRTLSRMIKEIEARRAPQATS